MCGAAPSSGRQQTLLIGLSPRVWGSHPIVRICGNRHGSIPTCVGQPRRARRKWSELEVYPHVCGAARSVNVHGSKIPGLSPRVWGSHVLPSVKSGRPWSIPTCVGQPITFYPSSPPFTVYPHVCGAAGFGYTTLLAYGLSPRVWGSQSSAKSTDKWKRSIPTCVGQPFRPHPPRHRRAVYPHVCGAAFQATSPPPSASGLSPRVWGSQAMGRDKGFGERSIPTCVGQPLGELTDLWRYSVYPHVCGAA